MHAYYMTNLVNNGSEYVCNVCYIYIYIYILHHTNAYLQKIGEDIVNVATS